MREMHFFDDLYSADEKSVIKSYKNKQGSFESIKAKLLSGKYKDSAEYLQDAESVEEIVVLNKAFTLGKEYVKEIAKDMTLEEKKVALYGFTKELNVVKQIKGGESLENLILLIDAQSYDDFVLMDYFDPTGSFINYPAVKNFLISKN